MTQQIMLKKCEQKTNQKHLVECEAKNPLSSITAMDMIGLTWIFKDENLLEEFK
ncbi:MAG: hypothetical protein OEX98_01605 [Nitrosopumilus sp.]|nr:hypothetical protein [Nitrosopumilus sp.]